jgi:hypothetical protein
VQGLGYAACGVYLIDAHFMVDPSKFVSGCLLCLSTMVSLVRQEDIMVVSLGKIRFGIEFSMDSR